MVSIAKLLKKCVAIIAATSNTKVYNGTTSDSAAPTFQVAGLPADTLFSGDSFTTLTQAFESKNAMGSNGSTLQVSYAISDGNSTPGELTA